MLSSARPVELRFPELSPRKKLKDLRFAQNMVIPASSLAIARIYASLRFMFIN